MKVLLKNSFINFRSSNQSQSLYSIDANKNIQKFANPKEAADSLGLEQSAVSFVMSGQMHRVGNYTFLPSEEVEKISDDCDIKIDYSKILQAQHRIIPAIYAIDKNGNYTRYPSQMVASRELNITPGCISRCINSEAGKCKGYVFVSSLDVEKATEDGSVVVNEAKIENLAKKLIVEDAYYVIDKNGKFSRYSSIEETSKATGFDQDVITKDFIGYKKVVDDYTFVKARHLETKKHDGTPVLDEDSIITVFIGNRRAFFAVNKTGNATLFSSLSQAYGEIGSSYSSITNCINGRIKNVDGYTYATPTQVLCVNDKNEIVVSKEKVSKLLKERF